MIFNGDFLRKAICKSNVSFLCEQKGERHEEKINQMGCTEAVRGSSDAGQMVRCILPTVMSSLCFCLFTIIDGIFVGNGIGTDALGAVNLVMPFVMIANALFLLSSIGAISIAAIDIGEGKTKATSLKTSAGSSNSNRVRAANTALRSK